MSGVYQCYLLGARRTIAGRQDFSANNDEEAIVKARALLSESKLHGFELWEGLRDVHKENAEDEKHP
jgi:hypothetical protein